MVVITVVFFIPLEVLVAVLVLVFTTFFGFYFGYFVSNFERASLEFVIFFMFGVFNPGFFMLGVIDGFFMLGVTKVGIVSNRFLELIGLGFSGLDSDFFGVSISTVEKSMVLLYPPSLKVSKMREPPI